MTAPPAQKQKQTQKGSAANTIQENSSTGREAHSTAQHNTKRQSTVTGTEISYASEALDRANALGGDDHDDALGVPVQRL